MHDIVIRGGQVVDGTGAGPVVADVAVDGDRITAVGQVGDSGRREIDAEGRIVTPGFIDVHTHLDAQLFWDPVASPSCFHGVSTVVVGNCGVTFAPVRRDQHRDLASMMDAIEDIPTDTIMDGLSFDWETYGEFIGSLGRRELGINVGGLVGHATLRYYVMGERSFEDVPASDEDVALMAKLVGDAIDGGALGFSTSRSFLHCVTDGRALPGTFARPEELHAIAGAMAERGRGTYQVVPRLGERDGAERQNSVAEMTWMEDVSRASGRPLTFAITQSDRRPDLWDWVMQRTAEARSRGANLRPQTSARGSGILYGLVARTPWDGLPGWAEFAAKPFAEKLAALSDEAVLGALVREADQPVEHLGPLAPKDPAKLYLLPPGVAKYDVSPENSLAAEAARRGTTPAGALLEFLRDTNGLGLLYYPVLNQSLEAVEAMLDNPDVVLGLGDAGAHVALTMDAGQPTYYLSHWVRDKQRFDLGRAVYKLAKEGADLFGIADRGVLAPGAYADVNVIDLDGLELYTPQMVHDFPLGAPRFVQRAKGYNYSLLNGQVILESDEITDARPGTVVSAR